MRRIIRFGIMPQVPEKEENNKMGIKVQLYGLQGCQVLRNPPLPTQWKKNFMKWTAVLLFLVEITCAMVNSGKINLASHMV